MSCHLIRAWIFRWNVSCSSFSSPGAIGIFEVVTILFTIFFSYRWTSFQTFRAQLSVNFKCSPCSTNMILLFATTIPLAIALITLQLMGAPLRRKVLIVWIAFFIIFSGRSLERLRFFVFKMITSLSEDSFCLRYALLNWNTVCLRRFGKSVGCFLTALAMFVLASYRLISALSNWHCVLK